MATIANRTPRLNPSCRHTTQKQCLPQWFLLSDIKRLEDPSPVLTRLPKGGAVILRHTDPIRLEAIARKVIVQARRLRLKVLIAGNPRLAARLKADGVHLSQLQAQRGPLRIRKPGWIVTAAAHDRQALWAARYTNADAVLLSPVFATASHPDATVLGVIRFSRLARMSSCPVIALGGIEPHHLQSVAQTPAWGVAAIGLWSAIH